MVCRRRGDVSSEQLSDLLARSSPDRLGQRCSGDIAADADRLTQLTHERCTVGADLTVRLDGAARHGGKFAVQVRLDLRRYRRAIDRQ
jgi:hypothetical protein